MPLNFTVELLEVQPHVKSTRLKLFVDTSVYLWIEEVFVLARCTISAIELFNMPKEQVLQ